MVAIITEVMANINSNNGKNIYDIVSSLFYFCLNFTCCESSMALSKHVISIIPKIVFFGGVFEFMVPSLCNIPIRFCLIDVSTSFSANGSTAFKWKLCCHWLKSLWQQYHDASIWLSNAMKATLPLTTRPVTVSRHFSATSSRSTYPSRWREDLPNTMNPQLLPSNKTGMASSSGI